MKKRSTIRERIVSKVMKTGRINTSMVSRMFRNADSTLIQCSKMRRVRELHQEGLLTRTSRGQYIKTKRFDSTFR